jgi:hypothetical protein
MFDSSGLRDELQALKVDVSELLNHETLLKFVHQFI